MDGTSFRSSAAANRPAPDAPRVVARYLPIHGENFQFGEKRVQGDPRGRGRPPHLTLPPAGLFGEILGEEEARLAPAHDVEVAIAIQILNYDLHAAAHAAAVVDDVADPLDGAVRALAVLIPVQFERFALAGIVAVVGHVALAGDQVLLPIADVFHQDGGVGLRPGAIDDVRQPAAVGGLLEPHQAVIVRAGGEDVHAAVLVDIDGVHEAEFGAATGGGRGAAGSDGVLVPVGGVKLPLARGAHIGGRFQPTFGCEDVVAPVAVDIAHADAVAVALPADDVLHPLAVLQFEPGQRNAGAGGLGARSNSGSTPCALPSLLRSTRRANSGGPLASISLTAQGPPRFPGFFSQTILEEK